MSSTNELLHGKDSTPADEKDLPSESGSIGNFPENIHGGRLLPSRDSICGVGDLLQDITTENEGKMKTSAETSHDKLRMVLLGFYSSSYL